MTELTKERDLAEQDADDLREGLEEMQQMYDEERTKMMDKLKKDLRVKDRQIENLEEQLQAAMSSGYKKLRRGLSERHVYIIVGSSLCTKTPPALYLYLFITA